MHRRQRMQRISCLVSSCTDCVLARPLAAPLRPSLASHRRLPLTSPSLVCFSASPSAAAPVGNGGITDKYTWTQTLAETTVSVALPAGTTAKMLNVTIEPDSLHVSLKGGDKTVYLSGAPDEKIDSDNATWTLETDGKGGKLLDLFLPKLNKMSWWKCVVKGDPCINTKKIVPENSKLEDLDGDTRSTVEKMMVTNNNSDSNGLTATETAARQHSSWRSQGAVLLFWLRASSFCVATVCSLVCACLLLLRFVLLVCPSPSLCPLRPPSDSSISVRSSWASRRATK